MNDQNNVEKALAMSNIGGLLLQTGRIDDAQTQAVLALQKEQGLRFGEAAIKLGFVNDDDIRQALSQQFSYPYLKDGDNALSNRLVAAYHPFAPEVEQLRSLRSQLKMRWVDQGNKAFAVSSHEAHAGSTYIASNLAVVFSHLGERTLLIDANLRAAQQHELFKLGNRLGLSDILAGRADLACATRIDTLLGLSVLSAGTNAPNPQELLSRPLFSSLLRDAARHFDVIILDTPGLDSCADAQIVAANAGGVLLVANCHKTRMSGLQRAVEQLQTTGAQIIGCVLNETT